MMGQGGSILIPIIERDDDDDNDVVINPLAAPQYHLSSSQLRHQSLHSSNGEGEDEVSEPEPSPCQNLMWFLWHTWRDRVHVFTEGVPRSDSPFPPPDHPSLALIEEMRENNNRVINIDDDGNKSSQMGNSASNSIVGVDSMSFNKKKLGDMSISSSKHARKRMDISSIMKSPPSSLFDLSTSMRKKVSFNPILDTSGRRVPPGHHTPQGESLSGLQKSLKERHRLEDSRDHQSVSEDGGVDEVEDIEEYEDQQTLRKEAESATIKNPIFVKFIVCCILLNTLLLASYHYEQPDWLTQVQNIGNIVLSIIFFLEFILRLFALGLFAY